VVASAVRVKFKAIDLLDWLATNTQPHFCIGKRVVKTLVQEAVRIPETVSRKTLAAGENTANNRRLAPCRSQEQTFAVAASQRNTL